jgi:hypothetical protein
MIIMTPATMLSDTEAEKIADGDASSEADRESDTDMIARIAPDDASLALTVSDSLADAVKLYDDESLNDAESIAQMATVGSTSNTDEALMISTA